MGTVTLPISECDTIIRAVGIKCPAQQALCQYVSGLLAGDLFSVPHLVADGLGAQPFPPIVVFSAVPHPTTCDMGNRTEGLALIVH